MSLWLSRRGCDRGDRGLGVREGDGSQEGHSLLPVVTAVGLEARRGSGRWPTGSWRDDGKKPLRNSNQTHLFTTVASGISLSASGCSSRISPFY